MPPSDAATQSSPLAPSVEKAYYRKCIALKRRLNEVELANEEAKIRRARLDRAIMKMRLERAFLLNELRRRMDYNVDQSEGSGEEGMATPPPDRPHRDKRRKLQPSQPTSQSTGIPSSSAQTNSYPVSGTQQSVSDLNSTSGPPLVQGPDGQILPANAVYEDGRPFYPEPSASRPLGSTTYPATHQGSPNSHPDRS